LPVTSQEKKKIAGFYACSVLLSGDMVTWVAGDLRAGNLWRKFHKGF